jgi:hypothetical protein
MLRLLAALHVCTCVSPPPPLCHQVEDDKAQITAVIQQLDEKKRIALEETWKHVSVKLRPRPRPDWVYMAPS